MTPRGAGRDRAWRGRGGFAAGDAVILLAALSLAVVLVLPRLERRAFQARVEEAAGSVDAARSALLEHRREQGGWPPASDPGRVPPGLEGRMPGGGASFLAGGHPLEFVRWTLLAPPGSGTAGGADGGRRGPPLPTGDGREVGSAGSGDAVDGSEGAASGQEGEASDEAPEEDPEEPSTRPRRPVLLGALTLHAADSALLAALLRAYGSEQSFVRDTTWTLILGSEDADSPPGDGADGESVEGPS